MTKPLILFLNASPFTDGEVGKMLNDTANAARERGAHTQIFHLGQIPHDDGRRDENKPLEQKLAELPEEGSLREIIEAIIEADGVVWCGPTRCFNMSSRFLALLCWMMVTVDAPDYPLAGKVAMCMTACEEDGAQGANEKLVSALSHLGFAFPPFSTYFYNKSSAESSEGDWAMTDRRSSGRGVVDMVRMLEGKRITPDWEED